MKKLFFLAAAAMAAFGGTITTGGAVNGTTIAAIDITGSATLGDEMAGMIITGIFSTGADVSCLWATTGAGSGGCTGVNGSNGFQFGLSGDTFSAAWNLTSITGGNLTTLIFDGLPGFTVFDRNYSPFPGTDGSADGNDADGSTSLAGVDGVATYSNIVGTLGNPPVGDLYAIVTMAFGNGGLTPGATASFVMDADNIGIRGGAPGSGVPEPSTFVMVGGGLLALALYRKRRV